MKKRNTSIVIAALLACALAAGNVSPVCAAPVTKDETVYVKTDASGEKTSVTVSDQLSNIGKDATIEDISALIGIENVKGDETFSRTGKTLTWKNDGSNKICYQGTSEEALPVGMTISYELDGKLVSYDDLKGKSGHLTIKVTYENYTEGDAFAPFMMATGIIIDGDAFTNIEVEHGKLMSDGEKDIVLGYGFPGLKSYLQLEDTEITEDIEISEGFTMEADVTDFDKITCMSLATNEVFTELSADRFDDMDDVKDDMTKLQDASAQLVDGSGQLKDGVDTLKDASGGLIDGVNQLAAGGKTLVAGTDTLYAGAKDLKAGASSLTDGTGQLADGSGVLVNGTAQLAAGAKDAKTGAVTIEEGLGQAKQGAMQLSGGLTQSKEGAGTLKEGLGQVKQATAGVSQLAQAMAACVEPTATGSAEVSVYVDNGDSRSAVRAALEAAGADEDMISAAVNAIDDKEVSTTADVTVPVNAATSQIAAYAQQLVQTAGAADGGVTQLQGGADQLAAGLGQLEAGASDLVSGLTQLEGGAGSLVSGLGTLESGASQLKDGSQTLDAGIKAADTGARQLKDGSVALADGANTLNSGANTLSDGLSELLAGLGELTAGIEELFDGAVELHDGMVEFDQDGIHKLVDLFDDDLGDLLDRVSAMVDQANAYTNYSGLGSNMEGSVKFVFMTEE